MTPTKYRHSDAITRRTGFIALMVWIMGAAMTSVVAWDLWLSERARHQLAGERLADSVAANIVRETDLALALQTAVAAKLTTTPWTDARGYIDFIGSTRLFETLPSIRAIAFAPLIRNDAVADLERTIASDRTRQEAGYPPFRIWPEGHRERYAPTTLVAPVDGNERVFGFDILSNAARRAAFEASIRDWRPRSSAPVVLTQDQDTKAPGILIVKAVGPPQAVVGVVAMGVTIERLLKPLNLGGRAYVEIDDIGDTAGPSEPALVFRGGEPSGQNAVAREVNIAGRIWRIRVSPSAGPEFESVLLVMLIGLLVTGFGGLAVHWMHQARARLEETVAARTKELRESGEALALANRELRQHAAELARANAAKGEFLARLGHELRTPLNAIIGFSELMRMGIAGQLSHKQSGYVADIHGAGTHLLAVVNRLLDIVKLERNEVPLDRVPFNPLAELATVIAMVQVAAQERRVAIEFDDRAPCAPEDYEILGDPLAFRQIASNLLENAIKFSHAGSVVRLALSRLGDSVVLEVDDSGVGIPADQLALVFEPFHQVEIGDARRFGGAGLGLSIVRGLAERMGGSVVVASELGQGSRFRVRLLASKVSERRQVRVSGDF